MAKNSFLTYVYIPFGTEFFPTKQPLIPRLARKNKEVGLDSYPVFGYTEVLGRFQVIPDQKMAPGLYKVVRPGAIFFVWEKLIAQTSHNFVAGRDAEVVPG